MTDVISKLKNYHTRMTTAINELEYLEEDDEFLDTVCESYGEIVMACEHRREVMQRRKYGR